MISCVPIPALLGLKTDPITPCPKYVPPVGEAIEFRSSATASIHRSISAPRFTTGTGLTMTLISTSFEQPRGSAKA